MLLLASITMFNPLHFLIGFLILVCVLAIVIIAAKWLLSLTGVAIP